MLVILTALGARDMVNNNFGYAIPSGDRACFLLFYSATAAPVVDDY